ncbi:hypothetical protein V8G54_002532 [Vigna mungo]|uniref:Uncharacterized protein n=1 Tax=Vigna mungo TaxID=3915 RepID=A0AAQ3SBY8_VIGMU
MIIEESKRRKVQSEGADAEGGVAIGESETGVDLREFAAAEEAVAVGQLSVVLDGALFGRRGDSGGRVGPLSDGFGVAVVHGERVNVVVALAKLPEGDEGDNNDENESEHFLRLGPLR